MIPNREIIAWREHAPWPNDVQVEQEALWTVHVYWASILLVLLLLGAGQISVDHIIRIIARH